jgi:hypothetical protein
MNVGSYESHPLPWPRQSFSPLWWIGNHVLNRVCVQTRMLPNTIDATKHSKERFGQINTCTRSLLEPKPLPPRNECRCWSAPTARKRVVLVNFMVVLSYLIHEGNSLVEMWTMRDEGVLLIGLRSNTQIYGCFAHIGCMQVFRLVWVIILASSFCKYLRY